MIGYIAGNIIGAAAMVAGAMWLHEAYPNGATTFLFWFIGGYALIVVAALLVELLKDMAEARYYKRIEGTKEWPR